MALVSAAWEMPKSMTRQPAGPRMTLDGLMSRWTTPTRSIAPMAWASSSARRQAPVAPSGPDEATASDRLGPGMYSVAIHSRSPS